MTAFGVAAVESHMRRPISSYEEVRPDSMQRGMANGGLTDVRKSAVMQRAMNDQPGVPMTGMGTQPMKVMKNGGKVMKKAEGGVSDFGKAFRDARKMGVDQFTFNGKKYTTEMAKPAAAKPNADGFIFATEGDPA